MAKSNRSSGGTTTINPPESDSPYVQTRQDKKPLLLTVEVGPDQEVPILDLSTMTPEEKELFFNVVRSVNHSAPHPVQQVSNMPGLFGSMSRASMIYAGMHVAEYRRLLREVEADQDSIPNV